MKGKEVHWRKVRRVEATSCVPFAWSRPALRFKVELPLRSSSASLCTPKTRKCDLQVELLGGSLFFTWRLEQHFTPFGQSFSVSVDCFYGCLSFCVRPVRLDWRTAAGNFLKAEAEARKVIQEWTPSRLFSFSSPEEKNYWCCSLHDISLDGPLPIPDTNFCIQTISNDSTIYPNQKLLPGPGSRRLHTEDVHQESALEQGYRPVYNVFSFSTSCMFSFCLFLQKLKKICRRDKLCLRKWFE